MHIIPKPVFLIQKFTANMPNPFLSLFSTPYGIPPFTQIREQHFLPAIRTGIRCQKEEIRAILSCTDSPGFDNTILALEESGAILRQVTAVMYNLSYAHTSLPLQQILQDTAPLLSAHQDSIFMHPKLHRRVAAVWENRTKLRLSGEKKKLTEQYFKTFLRGGAALKSGEKKELAEINRQLSLLSLDFSRKILTTVNQYQLVLDDESQLRGLPEDIRQAAAHMASETGHHGKWMFTLQNSSVIPFLQYADSRPLRHEIWNAYVNKGSLGDENDTDHIVREMTMLRSRKASILGYKNYAAYVLEEQMAKEPVQVSQLLRRLWTPALKTAQKEAAMLQERINHEESPFTLQPWDWRYYAEKHRKEVFGLDELILKPYFRLESVRNGVFEVSQQLYGIRFQALSGLPVYHPDVESFLVSDDQGKDIGILLFDFFPRESKQGGAWMTSFSEQYKKRGKRIIPVISVVCNFSPPLEDSPSLLTLDEVNTLFHECGHALHGLLSDVKYKSLSGTNVPTDFVELPSQIMENWCQQREVLHLFARHYQTGEALPAHLIDQIEAAQRYGQGFATTEYLAACFLDMAFHTHESGTIEDITAFENQIMAEINMMPEIKPRYGSTYFSHIFAGGYSSGYYSYIWSEVLDSDAFALFREKGIFDKNTATLFRKHILEKGGSENPMVLYQRFRGRNPEIEPLLEKRGLGD